MKHKILYIPEAKYLVFGYEDSSILEILYNHNIKNIKTNKYATNPEEILEAMFTWSKNDSFFETNKIVYPLIRNEFEIVELPDSLGDY
jgi:hypothetical protein